MSLVQGWKAEAFARSLHISSTVCRQEPGHGEDGRTWEIPRSLGLLLLPQTLETLETTGEITTQEIFGAAAATE